ncbi:MAG: metallophosphoesterase family protein [Opitutales bacterium]|nr:metallophosphoesterase family protein [Opitutales bacterium]
MKPVILLLPLLFALVASYAAGPAGVPVAQAGEPGIPGIRGIAGAGFDPPGLFLTWEEDPTRSMVIDWHTHNTAATPDLQYRRRGHGDWITATKTSLAFPFTDHWIHRARLRGLRQGTEYEFRWGSGSSVYRFRTMPAHATDSPVRAVIGGDTMHHRHLMDAMNRVAAATEPDFIVWGGDLAYADGRSDLAYRWINWFDSIKKTLITPDRRVIPIIVGIGNHEVRGGYVSAHGSYRQENDLRLDMAPYFYRLFAFPGQPGFGYLDFGDYLRLIILDSGHTNPVEGLQTEWLRARLGEPRSPRHVVPVYHVPAYPSVRTFSYPLSEDVRRHWVPLFENHGVRVVFENHDHAYKRTFPIRRGMVDFDGIVYLGDGSWGVETRTPSAPRHRWYLVETAALHHGIIADIDENEIEITVLGTDNAVIDSYGIPPTDDDIYTAVNQIFPRAYPVGAGFWFSDWFGLFNMNRFPWIHHDEHGWLFVRGRDAQGIWFHDPGNGYGWFWTNSRTYPNLFRMSRRDWVRLDPESGQMVRGLWFFGFSDNVGWLANPRPEPEF